VNLSSAEYRPLQPQQFLSHLRDRHRKVTFFQGLRQNRGCIIFPTRKMQRQSNVPPGTGSVVLAFILRSLNNVCGAFSSDPKLGDMQLGIGKTNRQNRLRTFRRGCCQETFAGKI